MEYEGRSREILIVDDDDRIVELMAWFLKKRGYEVRTAASFEQARERILERWPELMLSDLDLGPESALEELPRLEAAEMLPATLVVSGYLDPKVVRHLDRIPSVLGTLAKPFDFAVLERRVRECLEQLAREPIAQPAHPPLESLESDAEDEEGWIEITAAPRPPGARAPAEQQRARAAGERAGRAPFRLR